MALKPCGTDAAYRRHRRKGEDPCDACRAAHAKHNAVGRKAEIDAAALERRSRLAIVSSDVPEVKDAKAQTKDQKLPDVEAELLWMYKILRTSVLEAPPQNRPGVMREMREILKQLHHQDEGSAGQDLAGALQEAMRMMDQAEA